MAPNDQPEEKEQNIYGDSARQSLMEDGEISAEEDAFMAGYESSEAEEEDSASDAYEQAFATRRSKKRRGKTEDPFEEDEDLEEI